MEIDISKKRLSKILRKADVIALNLEVDHIKLYGEGIIVITKVKERDAFQPIVDGRG